LEYSSLAPYVAALISFWSFYQSGWFSPIVVHLKPPHAKRWCNLPPKISVFLLFIPPQHRSGFSPLSCTSFTNRTVPLERRRKFFFFPLQDFSYFRSAKSTCPPWRPNPFPMRSKLLIRKPTPFSLFGSQCPRV